MTLANFLEYYRLDISTIYGTKCSFARLSNVDFNEELEDVMTKAFARICAIDSRRWIEFLMKYLPNISKYSLDDFNECQIRMLQMMQFTIWQKSYGECGFTDLLGGFRQLEKSPVMLGEMLGILRYNYDRIDFIDKPVDLGFDCPLDLHCTYTRDQILVAMDFMKPNTVREGTKYLSDKKLDVHFVTLNKAEKDYSPTTMYNDYSINEVLFHWQSQSTTSDTSTTGRRYIDHRKTGDRELIFVREYKNTKLGAAPYTFLGIADYISHEGSKPMNVVWKLREPIPAKYIKKTNKLVV